MLNETQETLAASVNAEGYWEASNHIRVPLSWLLGKIIESPPLLHASEPEWEESEEEKKETVPLSREQDYLGRCGSKRFAKEMAAVSRFADLDRALQSAREIWFNKIDVNGWLEAFVSHQVIGAASPSISQWSKEKQSTALATATDSTTQKFVEWNARYRAKLGFVFLICASGRGTPAILAELKVYPNQVFKMGSFDQNFVLA